MNKVRGREKIAAKSPPAAEKSVEMLAMPWIAAHAAAAEDRPKNPIKKRVFSLAMHLHSKGRGSEVCRPVKASD